MKISIESDCNGLSFGFDLSITKKHFIIGFLFWGIIFKIE